MTDILRMRNRILLLATEIFVTVTSSRAVGFIAPLSEGKWYAGICCRVGILAGSMGKPEFLGPQDHGLATIV